MKPNAALQRLYDADYQRRIDQEYASIVERVR